MTPSPGDLPPSRHEQVKALFLGALDSPRGKRAAYLAEACRGDEKLHQEVLELFFLHGENDSMLDAPLDGASALAGLAEPPDGCVGTYRLIRELGRGGMGVVHLAERDGKPCAVKLLVAGALSPEVRERFRLEAEILGRLHHEGIARMFEVGETPGPGGVTQPWIAMEYVEGRPLLEHADAAMLTLEERLELLATVCDAVQHAHARGIVHRDLKPSNILVRPDGRPVVLDFGVARLTGGDERPTELLTRTGQLLGTPQYMSPEQVQADPAGITPASDVYSLGIIAYEVLAGRLPYEASSVSLHRAIVTILTVEPPALGALNRALRGPLERIVAKALEKNPLLRYPEAGPLADDIRRKLAGRAVRARGPGLARRIQRWSRARRRLVTAMALVSIAGLLVAAWVLGTDRAVPRERVLAAYREAETLVNQSVPLLYESERTPARLRQVIDLETRARLLIEQVPAMRHHDVLLRMLEKDLGTAEFLLGEQTWDTQPYRSSIVTLAHALSLPERPAPGWDRDVQLGHLGVVPQVDLIGLLAAAELGVHRLWGEGGTLRDAGREARRTLAENIRVHGPPRPLPAVPTQAISSDPFAFCYNSLAEITTDLARFTADTSVAKSAVLYSDSAIARRVAFMQNWPALGSLLFERGRALRTYGALARSPAALDSSQRYLTACADYRGPERPWVFAQTRAELASLGLDRARQSPDPARAAELLRQARSDVEEALSAIRGKGFPAAAGAVLMSLEAEAVAEAALAARDAGLLSIAESLLVRASRSLPSTALPREAAWVCVRQAVLARARFGLFPDVVQLDAARAALGRAQVLMESRGDSLVLHCIVRERAAIERAAALAGR